MNGSKHNSDQSTNTAEPKEAKLATLLSSEKILERKRAALERRENDSKARLKRLWHEKRPTINGKIMSEEDAAKALGVSQSTVNRQISGKSPIGLELAYLWAELLDVDINEIRPGSPSRDLCESEPYKPPTIDPTVVRDCDAALKSYLTKINRELGHLDKLEIIIELYERQMSKGNTKSIDIDLNDIIFQKSFRR